MIDPNGRYILMALLLVLTIVLWALPERRS